jgi:hypothetical protein
MKKIFSGQSSLRIIVKTGIDLTYADTASIKYAKPNGTRGTFIAGVLDRTKGTIVHECLAGEIDMAGWWVFWASLQFDDGRSAAGEPVKVFVWQEGALP